MLTFFGVTCAWREHFDDDAGVLNNLELSFVFQIVAVSGIATHGEIGTDTGRLAYITYVRNITLSKRVCSYLFAL
jgi:hypothetical protein